MVTLSHYTGMEIQQNKFLKEPTQTKWHFISKIVRKWSHKHPITVFKILGYTMYISHRWSDYCKIKNGKPTTYVNLMKYSVNVDWITYQHIADVTDQFQPT